MSALRREVQRLLDQPIGTQKFLQFVGGAAGDTLSAGPNLAGQQLGSFQVKTLLGRGGMGEVYLAHDTKLGRDVAIKVLPRAFTEDAGRLTNFEREARVVASFNHPNIAAIHGVVETNGVRGLVLELVDGDTLGERLADDGSDQRNLTPKTPGDLDADWISRAPAWSRTGHEIYFMSSRPSTGLDTEVFVMNADATAVTRVTSSIGVDGSPRVR